MDRTNASRPRRLLWRLLCVLVTAGAIGYVLAQINWRDQLVVGGRRVAGWAEAAPGGGRVLRCSDGRAYPLPGEGGAAPDRRGAFVPGLVTLFRNVDPLLLGLALLAAPVPILLMAVRWQILLRTDGIDPGLGEVVRLTWVGILANNFLPGSTGTEVAQIVCICRRAPGKKLAAAMTVLLSRYIGLGSLFLVGALALATQYHRPELALAARAVCGTMLALGVSGVLLFSRRVRAWLRWEAVLRRLPLGARLKQLDDCLLHYRGHPGALAAALGLSVLIQVASIADCYLLGLALGLNTAPVYYFIFLPIIFVVGASTPAINGLGVREAAFQVFFAGAGASPAAGLGLAILHRGAALLVSLPGAVPFYREVRAGATRPPAGGAAPVPPGAGADPDRRQVAA
jgi:uncharacterized protein (TIRG00374 family)